MCYVSFAISLKLEQSTLIRIGNGCEKDQDVATDLKSLQVFEINPWLKMHSESISRVIRTFSSLKWFSFGFFFSLKHLPTELLLLPSKCETGEGNGDVEITSKVFNFDNVDNFQYWPFFTSKK